MKDKIQAELQAVNTLTKKTFKHMFTAKALVPVSEPQEDYIKGDGGK